MKNYKLSLIAARSFLQYCLERRVYAFLGRTNSWGSPDLFPSGNQESVYNYVNDFNETIFAKRILESNFSLVIRRVNWEEVVFAQWNDRDPLIAEKNFYCLTSDNRVYKCISNNNNAPSTIEPHAINTVPFTTADGYVWRFMFDVTSDAELMFLTPDYIPVKEILLSETGYENQYASQIAAIPGSIDRIDIVQGGSKYGAGTTIVITGDGSGATASLTRHPSTGAITAINITSRGVGYTWANVVLNDPQTIPGSGAYLIPVLSPLFGHGFNPAEELFASKVVASCTIDGDEGGLIKGDFAYRKICLIADPKLLNNSYATNYRYDNTSSVTITGNSGVFVIGEKVLFLNGEGYVVYIDNNTLYLTGLNGVPSGIITGVTSSASGTISSTTTESFKISGLEIFKAYFNPRTKMLNDSISIKPLFSF